MAPETPVFRMQSPEDGRFACAQNTAAVLERVTASEEIVVTERGRPRWKVSVVGEQEDALTRLAREGRYTAPAADPSPWPDRPGGPSYTTAEADALLDEMHGDH